MLILKLMSSENKSDSNTSKQYQLLCVDNVKFERDESDGLPYAIITDAGGDTSSYPLVGNAYVMTDTGKTISTFAYSNFKG